MLNKNFILLIFRYAYFQRARYYKIPIKAVNIYEIDEINPSGASINKLHFIHSNIANQNSLYQLALSLSSSNFDSQEIALFRLLGVKSSLFVSDVALIRHCLDSISATVSRFANLPMSCDPSGDISDQLVKLDSLVYRLIPERE